MVVISDLSYVEPIAEELVAASSARQRIVVLGGIGTGRSTLLQRVAELDEQVVTISLPGLEETDAVAHGLVQSCARFDAETRAEVFSLGDDLHSAAAQAASRLAEAGFRLLVRVPYSWNILDHRGDDWRAIQSSRARNLLNGWASEEALAIAIVARDDFPWRGFFDQAEVRPLGTRRAVAKLEYLESERAWGCYRESARALHRALHPDDLLSPLVLRLAVGVVALGVDTEVVAQLATAHPSQSLRDLSRHLVARLRKPHYQGAFKAVRRLLAVRQPMPRESLVEITGVPDEHAPLITGCLCYGEPARITGKLRRLLIGSFNGSQFELEPIHQRLADHYAASDGAAAPAEARSTVAWLEKVHHLAHGGDACRDAWEQQIHPSPDFFWDIGRYLSIERRDYEAAANVYRSCVHRFPKDHYGWHYLGYNLAMAGLESGEAERAFIEATNIDPANPWWNSRLVTFLINQGRPRAARKAFQESLERVDSDGERVEVEPWLADHFHYWVASTWLEAGFAEDAFSVLETLPEGVVKQCKRLPRLLHEVVDAREVAALGESVYPPALPVDRRWKEPFQLPKAVIGKPLSRWYPGHIVKSSAEAVEIVYADPEEDPTTRRVLLTRVSASEWDSRNNGNPEDASGYVELGIYAESIRVVKCYYLPDLPSFEYDVRATLAYLRRWASQ